MAPQGLAWPGRTSSQALGLPRTAAHLLVNCPWAQGLSCVLLVGRIPGMVLRMKERPEGSHSLLRPAMNILFLIRGCRVLAASCVEARSLQKQLLLVPFYM